LGTTIKQAGSQEEQRCIERDLPIPFTRIASANGVKIMLNVSSIGASLKAGFLVGKRKDFRFIEKIASGVMKVIDPILTGSSEKYKSMPVDKFAKAMISLSKNPGGKPVVLHFSEIMAYI
jgi:hypothetical protein